MPFHLTLWLTMNVLVSYLVFGTRLGTAVNLGSVLTMIVSVLMNGPLEASNMADWVTAIIVLGGTGLIAFNVMAFIEQNLSAHQQTSQRLQAARKDALTEVLGRSATEEELERSIEQALKNRAPLSIIVTDIDHFKRVNDVHGHGTGDDVLRSFGKRLRRSVSTSGGQVGRWGGEEFLVILPGMARPDAMVVAERLRAEVADEAIAGLDVTASFGVASCAARRTPPRTCSPARTAPCTTPNATAATRSAERRARQRRKAGSSAASSCVTYPRVTTRRPCPVVRISVSASREPAAGCSASPCGVVTARASGPARSCAVNRGDRMSSIQLRGRASLSYCTTTPCASRGGRVVHVARRSPPRSARASPPARRTTRSP